MAQPTGSSLSVRRQVSSKRPAGGTVVIVVRMRLAHSLRRRSEGTPQGETYFQRVRRTSSKLYGTGIRTRIVCKLECASRRKACTCRSLYWDVSEGTVERWRKTYFGKPLNTFIKNTAAGAAGRWGRPPPPPSQAGGLIRLLPLQK